MTARTAWKQAIREHGPASRAAFDAFKVMQTEEEHLRQEAARQVAQAKQDRETYEWRELRVRLIECMVEEMRGDYPDVGLDDLYHAAEQNIGADAYGYTLTELRAAVAAYDKP